jgi:DNA-binding CsgD family transcriptional regulator
MAPDGTGATVVVFVSDPAAPAGDGATTRARLRAAYRLTPAEAAVAVAVARGAGLLAVAAAHGVGLATVRTQAQQVYRKTGVRGQAALARLGRAACARPMRAR